MCLHSNAHTLLTNLNEKMDLQPRVSIFQWVHKNVTQRKVQSLTDSWVKYLIIIQMTKFDNRRQNISGQGVETYR